MLRFGFVGVFAVVLVAGQGVCRAQFGGNVSYAQPGGRARAEQNEKAQRVLSDNDLPPNHSSMFVDASVLMNLKADSYVAVFGIAHEAETVEGCNKAMDATVKELSDALQVLGIGGAELFVDFVAQNRVYGFQVTGDVARENRVGFELKKNLSVRFKDKSLLDRIVAAAARSKVYDLVKVDYIVKDLNRVHDRLAQEASRVIKQKIARHEALLGIKLKPSGQVYAERPAAYYPMQMYDAYTAFENEQVSGLGRERLTIQAARKSRTFFYNGLDASGFDDVIDPVIVEPVVQFTLYLKVRYDIEPPKSR
jgi:uncharacterized protein YggE